MPSSKKPVEKKAAPSDAEQDEAVVTLDRRGIDGERREGDAEAADDDGNVTLETGAIQAPRRKKQRRRHIDPTTCERDYSDPEIEFMKAMDDYKHRSGRMFPTCSEVLEVVRDLGYVRLTEEERELIGLDDSEDELDGIADEDSQEELEEADF